MHPTGLRGQIKNEIFLRIKQNRLLNNMKQNVQINFHFAFFLSLMSSMVDHNASSDRITSETKTKYVFYYLFYGFAVLQLLMDRSLI